jgi:hypothetical protein
LHPATLTGIVNRLSARRLVTRVRDARDSRRVRLVPSVPVSDPPSISVESAVAAAFAEVRSLEVKHACRVLEAVAANLSRHAQEQASVGRRVTTRRTTNRGHKTAARVPRRPRAGTGL